jgi:hypothetical protein
MLSWPMYWWSARVLSNRKSPVWTWIVSSGNSNTKITDPGQWFASKSVTVTIELFSRFFEWSCSKLEWNSVLKGMEVGTLKGSGWTYWGSTCNRWMIRLAVIWEQSVQEENAQTFPKTKWSLDRGEQNKTRQETIRVALDNIQIGPRLKCRLSPR